MAKHKATGTRILCTIKGHSWIDNVEWDDYTARYVSISVTCDYCGKAH